MNASCRLRIGTATLGLVALVVGGCTDTGLRRVSLGNVAVVAGDFDFIEETLDSEGVGYDLFDGYIAQPFYDYDPTYTWWNIVNEVEDLLLNDGAIFHYNTVFLNCGMRGVGDRQYNGVFEDDQILVDDQAIADIRGFVEGGGSLYVSDWGYDLIERAWPNVIEFFGDDERIDDAQEGLPPDPEIEDNYAPVSARTAHIVDADLLEGLGRSEGDDEIRIVFDVDSWAVMESINNEATSGKSRVLVEGDVIVRDPNAPTGYVFIERAPLMVMFSIGNRDGKVVFTSFHNNPQVTSDVQAIMRQLIWGFDRDTTL